MKSPPKQLHDDDAHAAVRQFIKQYGSKTAKPKPPRHSRNHTRARGAGPQRSVI